MRIVAFSESTIERYPLTPLEAQTLRGVGFPDGMPTDAQLALYSLARVVEVLPPSDGGIYSEGAPVRIAGVWTQVWNHTQPDAARLAALKAELIAQAQDTAREKAPVLSPGDVIIAIGYLSGDAQITIPGARASALVGRLRIAVARQLLVEAKLADVISRINAAATYQTMLAIKAELDAY